MASVGSGYKSSRDIRLLANSSGVPRTGKGKEVRPMSAAKFETPCESHGLGIDGLTS